MHLFLNTSYVGPFKIKCHFVRTYYESSDNSQLCLSFKCIKSVKKCWFFKKHFSHNNQSVIFSKLFVAHCSKPIARLRYDIWSCIQTIDFNSSYAFLPLKGPQWATKMIYVQFKQEQLYSLLKQNDRFCSHSMNKD